MRCVAPLLLLLLYNPDCDVSSADRVQALLLLCCLVMWPTMRRVLLCRYAPLSIDFPSAVAALRQLAMKVQPHTACCMEKLPVPCRSLTDFTNLLFYMIRSTPACNA